MFFDNKTKYDKTALPITLFHLRVAYNYKIDGLHFSSTNIKPTAGKTSCGDVVLNSLLAERVEEQDTFKQTGLQWTNSLILLLLSAAPTAPGCVGMNAARRFSCLCCAAVKGIVGNFVWKVCSSQVQSRLGKVGGSGRIKFTSGDLVSTWSDVNLSIEFVLWQLLMTYHKFVRTWVGTRTGIDKRFMCSIGRDDLRIWSPTSSKKGGIAANGCWSLPLKWLLANHSASFPGLRVE